MRPKPKEPGRGFWAGWSRFVTGHPWAAMGCSALILVPLIIPLKSLQFGQEDIAATPKKTMERQAYDLMTRGFGPGYNGPLLGSGLGAPEGEDEQPVLHPEEAGREPADPARKRAEERQQTEEAARTGSAERRAAAGVARKAAEAARGGAEAAGVRWRNAPGRTEAARRREEQHHEGTGRADQGGEGPQRAGAGAGRSKGRSSESRPRPTRPRWRRRKPTSAPLEAKLAKAKTPKKQQQLQAELDQLQTTEQQQQDTLNADQQAQKKLRSRAPAAAESVGRTLLNKQKELAQTTVSLADQAEELGKQAYAINQKDLALTQQAAQVQVSAANTQTQAANLNTQKVQLQNQQKQAQQQQKQADQLQNQLTEELTKAGGDERGTDPRLVKLQDGLENTKGVALVSPPNINKSGDATVYTVIPTTDPAAPATADLVQEIRNYVIPRALAGTKMKAYVGGSTAANVDLASSISSRLLLVILAVVVLAFIILLTAYRAVIVAAQAAIVNVISVSAAFGVLTACFQWGWGLSIIGLDAPSGSDPIASYVPLMMFAVLFGLSMDYQVFLLSQVEHHRAQGEEHRESVRNGLATSARVIAAAGLIMISVFASFVLNGDPTVKQFGVGLAVGCLPRRDERPAALTRADRAGVEGELVGAPLDGQDPSAPRYRGKERSGLPARAGARGASGRHRLTHT